MCEQVLIHISLASLTATCLLLFYQLPWRLEYPLCHTWGHLTACSLWWWWSCYEWPSGVIVKGVDLRLRRLRPWASCSHTCGSDTKQYNLVPAAVQCSWEGNRKSGIVIDVCHRLIHLRAQGLREVWVQFCLSVCWHSNMKTAWAISHIYWRYSHWQALGMHWPWAVIGTIDIWDGGKVQLLYVIHDDYGGIWLAASRLGLIVKLVLDLVKKSTRFVNLNPILLW